ncbi:MAG: hypothetical protein C0601_09605 [Candidatus Muiribacterium halophilum]|uniref:Calcineurin-like phosphoesterase domain-containing protein n=1 Tax=Muiribacterium halophilum TaxID=2053465 RepID=A0A2N5ZDH3_MUIH1|nr:MAG: hypothetical protein C0601_09605 [Candidatus Muirbacterium halophilum]
MIYFLLFYSTIYALFQTYLFLAIKKAFSLNTRSLWILGTFLFIAMYFPLFQRIFLSKGISSLSLFFHITGYFLMVYSFLFPFFHLLTIGITKLIHLYSADRNFYISLTLLSLFVLYGSVEKDLIQINRFEINDFPDVQTKNIRITQISDVHIDMLRNKAFLTKIKDLSNTTDPDIVVSTGDLLDGLTGGDKEISSIFKDFDAKIGKYAVLGNHEVYSGLDRNIQIIKDGGFKIIQQRTVEAYKNLIIGGVDDPAVTGRYERSTSNYPDIFQKYDKKEKMLVLLKHQPVPYKYKKKPHLQLSGHSHGGQVFPFGFFVFKRYGFLKGMYDLEKDFHFYISAGTGTWGPPIRVLSRPEISVFDIKVPIKK